MLDSDLAALYGVDVRVLNQAVARNTDRFPSDFMLQLTAEEAESLRSQFVILKNGRGRQGRPSWRTCQSSTFRAAGSPPTKRAEM